MEKKWRTVIGPKSGLLDMDVKEIWKYRDLCLTFIRKNYITKYKQTVFGPFYMILSPLLTSGIFTVVFGTIAGIATDGIPQFLFYMSGNLVWGFFSGCVFENNNIFGNNAYIMGKVYFPRLVIPLANTITKLLNMLIQCIMFVIFYGIFQLRGFTFHSNAWIAVIPLLLLMISVLGFGIGLIFSSLTIKYRDLNVMLGVGMNLLMYAAPVIYPLSKLQGIWRSLALINPVAGVIETVRYAFFGVGSVPAASLLWGVVLTTIVIFSGLVLFNKVEKTFIDTI